MLRIRTLTAPRLLWLLALLAALVPGCGGSEPVAIQLTADDQMRYSLSQFTVHPGDRVELTFENVGKSPKATMAHNVVLLEAGESTQQFGSQAVPNGGTPDNGYLPPSMMGRVLAHTRLLGPGERDTLAFTAPQQVGDYPYLCTFPGHYATMTGRMLVRR